MVAEMVYYFLLPEVEKQTIREKGIIHLYCFLYYYNFIVKHTQRKHLLAAHRIVHGQLKENK